MASINSSGNRSSFNIGNTPETRSNSNNNNANKRTFHRSSSGSNNGGGGRNHNIAMIVPRGFKLRDEFVCPITKELIADPVIAADGHTYDRRAIEEWFYGSIPSDHHRNNGGNSIRSGNSIRRSSPKTGESLDHLHLIPNHNLKRLLGDMIREGGEGLYCPENSSSSVVNTDSPSQPQQANRNSYDNNLPSTVVLNDDNSKLVVEDENNMGVEVENIVSGIHRHNRCNNSATNDFDSGNNAKDTLKIETGPRLALVREQVLTARCLGPPESDWNGRSFRINESSSASDYEYGCKQGGRRRPNENNRHHSDCNLATDFVQFTDATVSRRHFEIRYFEKDQDIMDTSSAAAAADNNDNSSNNPNFSSFSDLPPTGQSRIFALRDLGSAGGTFIRIPPGKGLPLYSDTMIMLGKHQFVVENATPHTIHEGGEHHQGNSNNNGHPTVDVNSPINNWANNDIINSTATSPADAKTPKYGECNQTTYSAFFPSSNNASNHTSNNSKLDRENSFASSSQSNEDIDYGEQQQSIDEGNIGISGCNVVPCFLTSSSSPIISANNVPSPTTTNTTATNNNNLPNSPQNTVLIDNASHHQQIHNPISDTPSSSQLQPQQPPPQTSSASSFQLQQLTSETPSAIYLRCFAPEGTPIQGKQYFVNQDGATLGRKQGNSISFSHRVSNNVTNSNVSNSATAATSTRYSFVGIDSSISGEHATITYDASSQQLQLFDGVTGKASTNGTWLRLSPMYEQSNWFPLENKCEILIGTIRFQILIEEVVVERDIYD